MGRVKVEDHMDEFVKKNKSIVDMAHERAAKDILNFALITVPLESGELHESGEVEKTDDKYRVWFGKSNDSSDYSGAQEAGGANGVTYRNYTTPGTGAHYLRDAAMRVAPNMVEYYKQTAMMFGVN